MDKPCHTYTRHIVVPSCYDGFGHTHILRDFWLLPRVIYEILRLSILNLFEQAPWKEKNPGILGMVPSPVALLHHCIGIQSYVEYKQAMFKECCMRLNAESRNVCIYRRHIKAFIPLIDFPCISVDIFSGVHLPQNGL